MDGQAKSLEAGFDADRRIEVTGPVEVPPALVGGFVPQQEPATKQMCLRQCIALERPFKDQEELRNRIRRSTHKLVRRQTTWLRRIPEVHWIESDGALESALRRLRG